MPFAAIIFDFDGVLIESEFHGNVLLAELLTSMGHPTTAKDAVRHYTGLSGKDFIQIVEGRIGRKLPPDFHVTMRELRDRAVCEGIAAVDGAIEFVRSLPPDLPKAVASSSSTRWIRAHLEHVGLQGEFGSHVYSGAEHVENGKPSPDLYVFAARQLGVEIGETLIIEDSPVGAKGALASGATVVGLAAGKHCFAGHEQILRAVGVRTVVYSFAELAKVTGFDHVSR